MSSLCPSVVRSSLVLSLSLLSVAPLFLRCRRRPALLSAPRWLSRPPVAALPHLQHPNIPSLHSSHTTHTLQLLPSLSRRNLSIGDTLFWCSRSSPRTSSRFMDDGGSL